MTPQKFGKVVLSGGGVKGLAELGALHYFFEKGLYDPQEVTTYAGTSIGSVISLLCICGFSPMEIFTRIYTTEYFFETEGQSFWTALQNVGLLSIDSFTNKIQEMVVEKIGQVPTLKDLYEKTKKELIVAAVDITDEKVVYFSHKSHPELSAVNAVKMSCNLPIIFQKIVYEGHTFVDGGLLDGFPINQIDDGHTPILGVVTTGMDHSLKDNTIVGYLYRLINMPINMLTKLRCQNLGNNVTLVKMNCGNAPLFQFSMSSKVKMNLFLRGYHEARFVNNLEDITVKFE